MRAVEQLAAAGITQFVDIGTGIPTSPTVHEVARRTHPDARVVYFDDDPGVITGHPDVARLVDVDRPVASSSTFRRWMVPGSYLVISAGSSENLSDAELAEIHAASARTPRDGHLRSRAEIEALFAGFQLVEPGVVDVCRRRGFERPTRVSILAGVARRVDDGGPPQDRTDGHADGTPTPT